MPLRNRKSLTAFFPAVAAAAAIMAAGIAGNAVGGYFTGAPRMGHIISFTPIPPGTIPGTFRLVVRRADADGCVLDTAVMHRVGGSVVVESKAGGDDPGFQVHWAGERTSDDPADCGTDATVIIGGTGLELLATAAGGYVVNPGQTSLSASDDRL